MQEEFYALRRLPPYVFAVVNKLKSEYRAQGHDIIDFGMGNPTSPTPKHIIEKLKTCVENPKTHGYSASKGIAGLRKALSAYYERRFDVKINPETEAVVTLGSKEGLANLAFAITSPGDVILVPNPSYPIHPFGFIISGATVRSIPSDPGEDFLRAVDNAVHYAVPKPTAIVLNYPNNPTAAVADLDFYKEIVKYCKKHNIWIISDLAYSEIYFDDNPPPSILQIDGAKDITVEFTSMSKTFSMAGWRVGFAVGNERLINALTRVKSYLDYGAFTPIQVAATAALNGPEDCIADIRDMYKSRRDVLVQTASAAGFEIPSPKATMFAWVELPEKFKKFGSLAFSQVLLEGAHMAVAPGVGFGEYGDSHIRIALVENEQRIRQATKNLKSFFEQEDKWAAKAEEIFNKNEGN